MVGEFGEKIDLNNDDCITDYGLSYLDLIGLTGILAIEQNPDPNHIKLYRYKTVRNIIYVDMTINHIRLWRIIDLRRMVILNKLFTNNYKTGEGIGTKILSSQIEQAKRQQFNKLVLDAHRDEGDPDNYYCGYIVWAKLGFTMEFSDLQKFQTLIQKKFPITKSVFELIYFDAGGEDYWFTNGFKWRGFFDLLANENECLNLFYNSANKKNINTRLS